MSSMSIIIITFFFPIYTVPPADNPALKIRMRRKSGIQNRNRHPFSGKPCFFYIITPIMHHLFYTIHKCLSKIFPFKIEYSTK